LNGIDGYVTTALLASNVTVTAQVNGTVVRSTVPDPQTGEFFLARLESGADKKYDVVITADNRATVVIAAVPVMTATEVVLVATNALPITMLPSTTHTITGNVTLNPSNPDEVAAYVAAKQTLGGGTTVTVPSRAANLLTGDYTLVLPVVAPQLGQYGSGTLPIALVNQPAAAGKYAVEATATGFTPQAFDKNIALGDATQNFALVAAP